MAVHRPHTVDEPEALLYDDCERCDEHAEQLTGLDNAHIAALVNRLIHGSSARTKNESIAMLQIEKIAFALSRISLSKVSELLARYKA